MKNAPDLSEYTEKERQELLARRLAAIPDPTFKARMAYARAIRRGSRKHVTAEAFKASVSEAISTIKPAAKVK